MKLEYQVIDHGVDGSSYFQGCGVAFTRYSDCVTGVGDSAHEAGIDALESLCQLVDADDAGADALEQELDALPKRADAHEGCDVDDPQHEGCELYHYVSIRWRLTDREEVRP